MIEAPVLLFAEFIEVIHERIVISGQLIKVCGIINTKTCIQPYEHELNGVNLRICEVLVRTEEVLEI